jgi:hypothetical protein
MLLATIFARYADNRKQIDRAGCDIGQIGVARSDFLLTLSQILQLIEMEYFSLSTYAADPENTSMQQVVGTSMRDDEAVT